MHSYLVYEFVKCSAEPKRLGDPDCATDPEIEEWLSTKTVHLRVLNSKVDFSQFNEDSIRQNEIWLPAVPL